MRIVIFHGYLLGGTGSNVYNAKLAQTLAALGHEVHLFTQERHPERYPFVDAAGTWTAGALQIAPLHERQVRCTVYRPDIGGLLPVYVLDSYEGIQARTFAECTDAEIARYVGANVDAVREVCELVSPQLGLANHLVMGPVILARGLERRVPFAVKIHGSALEYTVKREPARFVGFAFEGLAAASGVLVGSTHTARSLWAALAGVPRLRERTRLGPPGVDVHAFTPRPAASAAAGVRALTARLAARPGGSLSRAEPAGGQADAFARDDRRAAAALARLDPARDRLVAYVGKLILSKGIDLLLVGWPLILCEFPQARLVVVGFGALGPALERLLGLLAAGDLGGLRELAAEGHGLEGGAPGVLSHMDAFLDRLQHGQALERERYLKAARAVPERVVLTGRLDHAELAELLPACEAVIVPSTFPEAFGMVALEAAACGALPISSGHSGLQEVAGALVASLPAQTAPLLSFPLDDAVVQAIADRVLSWMRAPETVRAQTRTAVVAAVRGRWSWERVAEGVLAASSGRLEELEQP